MSSGVVTTPELAWQSKPDVQAHQRRAVRSLFLTQMIGSLGMGAGMSIGSLLAYEVTADEGLAGISRILSAVSVALVAGPLAGLAVRRGRRAALLTGQVISACGAALLVLSARFHSLPLLMVGMLLFGAGSAANLQCRFAATDIAEPRFSARTMSMVVWAGTLGAVVGPLLAAPGGVVGRALGVPPIAGSYVLAGIGVLLAGLVVWLTLRPDPMHVAQEHGAIACTSRRVGTWRALGILVRRPVTRFALVAVVLNQMVMTSVMALTPVHMTHVGHRLPTVSVTLSLHILGMYAFSPLVGWLVDQVGEQAVILVGVAIHAAALTCSYLAGDNLVLIDVGLFLLGVGWSFGMVAGSALMSAAAPADQRAVAQGGTDMMMNVGAAVAAGGAGPVLAWLGYSGLALVAAALLVPILALAATVISRGGGASDERPAD